MVGWRNAGSQKSAGAAEVVEPAGENLVMGGVDVDEFNPHADAGLYDADYAQGFDGLVFSLQGDADSGVHGERTAGADEATAEGEVGGDTLGAGARFHVENYGVGGKGVANGVATVANRGTSRLRFGRSVVHKDDVAHSRLRPG